MELSLQDVFHGTTRQVTIDGERVNMKIKPGTRDGQVLRMKEKGAKGYGGGPNGDLLITVRLLKDQRFERQGDDIYFNHALDAIRATLGGTISVQTFDKKVSINIPPETDNNRLFRLKGMGMPNFEDPKLHGDAYVKIVLQTPKNISEKEKQLLMEFQQLRDGKES
jgi:curved DNA-binding protein